MSTTSYLALVPRDGIFCKDGRGWHTSMSGRGHALDWPYPSTVLGALRTAWGRSEELRTGTQFGPDQWRTKTASLQLGRTLVLRRKHDSPWHADDRTWPVPMDAFWVRNQSLVHRVEPEMPIAPTLGRDDDSAREGLWRPRLPSEKPLTPPRWWNSEDLSSWLAGQPVRVRKEEDIRATARRVQSHVGIVADRLTADDGILFSHDVVETLERASEWAIGAEVTLPSGAPPGQASLGSDGRLTHVEPLPSELFDPPAQLLAAFPSQGIRLVAVTPLCFANGWLPDGFSSENGLYKGRLPGSSAPVILRAAFVPRPIHVSGWDMVAKAPKPTSRMVAPGAVYFFEREDGQAFDRAAAEALWLQAYGSRTEEGFGRVVPGTWHPSRSKS